MARYDWGDELARIACPTMVVVPGAEPIGSTANYEPFRRRVRDVGMRVYEGAPHNVCDAFLEAFANSLILASTSSRRASWLAVTESARCRMSCSMIVRGSRRHS